MNSLTTCQRTQGIMPGARFEDLPLDVLYTIMSKLPPKEFARAKVLSSKLRCMWSACPRLTFNGVQVRKCNWLGLRQHTAKFIHEVNNVLQKHHGKVVETLEIRMDLVHSLLVPHLDDWVSFAVSSRTKNLTLDLKPAKFCVEPQLERYVFPFQLLDSGTISRLQHLQLSFVSLKPPPQLRGFPNLRKLHLQIAHVSKKDLVRVLYHCCKLEWLCIDRCHLNDELVVNVPLSHLLYLRIDCCKLTKVEFNAMNITTFDYHGSFIPIGLSHSLKLQSANIILEEANFQDALISLLNGLPYVKNLTLHIFQLSLKKQWLWDNPLKFSCLKHLQLFMLIYKENNADNILYSVSFLKATPFIEHLEVHFTGTKPLWFADVGPRRQDFGQCKYNYLKKMCITGFKGARGQLEFILHVAENAPALEVITVDTHEIINPICWEEGWGQRQFEEAKRIARTCLSRIIPPSAKLDVI